LSGRRHPVREQNGSPIFWAGYLCEGDRMVEDDPDALILWTKCGRD
jgi:hypothetical protein